MSIQSFFGIKIHVKELIISNLSSLLLDEARRFISQNVRIIVHARVEPVLKFYL